MTISPVVRTAAVAAPVLLFGYGALRLVDKLDGHIDKGGPLWNVGHVLFFAAVVLLGALAVGVRRTLSYPDLGNRLVANLATVAALAGMVAFLWVIAGDLFPAFGRAAPLPGALGNAGPAAFDIGLVVLLAQLFRARRLPAWSPVAVLLGFLLIPINLNLIPVAAVVVLAGLLPLAGLHRRRIAL